MKSIYLSQSIIQDAICPNFLLLHWHSAGRTILLEDHGFWIVSKLGKQKVPKHSFEYASCHISVFKKVMSNYIFFRQGAPYYN